MKLSKLLYRLLESSVFRKYFQQDLDKDTHISILKLSYKIVKQKQMGTCVANVGDAQHVVNDERIKGCKTLRQNLTVRIAFLN